MVVKESAVQSGENELNVFTMGRNEAKPIILVHGLRDSAKSLFPLGVKLAQKYLVINTRSYRTWDEPSLQFLSNARFPPQSS